MTQRLHHCWGESERPRIVTRAIHSQCGMHTRTGSKGPKARMIARFMHRRVRCPTRLLLLLPLFHLRAGRKRIFSRGGGGGGTLLSRDEANWRCLRAAYPSPYLESYRPHRRTEEHFRPGRWGREEIARDLRVLSISRCEERPWNAPISRARCEDRCEEACAALPLPPPRGIGRGQFS